MKYHHIGIPTKVCLLNETYFSHLKMYVSGYEQDPYGVAWVRYEEGVPYPEIIKNVAHVAFEVENIGAEINKRRVLIGPISPSDGVVTAFIEVDDVPIQLIQMDEDVTSDRRNTSEHKYHSFWTPTEIERKGDVHLEDLNMYVNDPKNMYRVGWVRYEEKAPYPEIVKHLPHLAFEVDDVEEAVKNKKIIIEPNSPTAGLVVGFIEHNGVPVEFIQIDRNVLTGGI